MISFSWRYVYLGTFALRFILALSESYIHPDEHFQSFEVMAQRVLGFASNPPWEFDATFPARSLVPLYLVYYIPLRVLSWLGLAPIQIWFSLRLLFMLVSWVVTDWCLYKMLPSKQERIKAIFFVSTSFVSLVYQSHTFSNSVETVLVIVTTWMINELRFLRATETKNLQYPHRDIVKYSAAIGACFALGVFNRITFPAFFVLPSFYFFQCCWRWKYIPFVSSMTFWSLAGLFVIIDTCGFSTKSISELASDPYNWRQYIVTPFNSLAYNTKLSNLALHGIHPFYTHILVNLPQILGPGLVFLLPNLRNSYWNTTPFMTAVSGLVFLSTAPHQELRFLLPVVPLLCSCFDVAALKHVFQSKPWITSFLMMSWLVFNALMCFLMGVMHQGGVVSALAEIHDRASSSESSSLYIWWRTYNPPTWMVGDIEGVQTIKVSQNSHVEVHENTKLMIVDGQGADISYVNFLVERLKSHVDALYIVTPVASAHLLNEREFNQTWSTAFHLDLDHLDVADKKSLQPGLGIYHLL